tara:strand:+ start:41919 stop:43040 length:1122 start_codon:yes stop_codon:yes gene_type:complete
MIFFIVAFYTGLWTIRIPDIKDQISTDYLGVGYIFFGFALGSIILMTMANFIIKKYSSRIVILIAGYGQGITWLIVPFINNLYAFVALAFVVGCTYGIFEVSMNFQASNIEKKKKKSMMSGFHAFFSLGLLIGSLITSIMVEMKISLFINIIVVVAILFPMTVFFSRFLGEDSNDSNKGNKQSIFFIWPIIIFILALITIADSFTEGAVDAWAALYMRDIILVSGFAIGAATLTFNFFMVLGRLVGDWIRDILGTFNFLILLFILSFIGLFIVMNYSSLYSAILGFGILGMGISSIVPLAYSLAGNIKEVDSAVGISIISISAYGVFMIAPAIMGFIAELYGLQMVFVPMIILFSICLIFVIIYKKEFAINKL